MSKKTKKPNLKNRGKVQDNPLGFFLGGLFEGKTQATPTMPKWMTDMSKRLMTKAEKSARGPYEAYQGDRLADFTDPQNAAFDLALSNVGSYNPLLDAASGAMSDATNRALTGPTMENIQGLMNPYQDFLKGRAQENYETQMSNIGAQAARAGAFGGSRHGVVEAMAGRDFQDSLLNIDRQAFDNAQNQFNTGTQQAMSGAQGLQGLAGATQQLGAGDVNSLLGVGGLQQQHAQQGLDIGYQDYLDERDWDINRAGQVLGLLSGQSGVNNQQITQSASPLSQIGGLAMAAGSMAMASDERVKENIEVVGELDNGLPVYKYNYKGDNKTQIGVMAQDVEKDNPGAVTEIGGIKHVDYNRAVQEEPEEGFDPIFNIFQENGYSEGGFIKALAGIPGEETPWWAPGINSLAQLAPLAGMAGVGLAGLGAPQPSEEVLVEPAEIEPVDGLEDSGEEGEDKEKKKLDFAGLQAALDMTGSTLLPRAEVQAPTNTWAPTQHRVKNGMRFAEGGFVFPEEEFLNNPLLMAAITSSGPVPETSNGGYLDNAKQALGDFLSHATPGAGVPSAVASTLSSIPALREAGSQYIDNAKQGLGALRNAGLAALAGEGRVAADQLGEGMRRSANMVPAKGLWDNVTRPAIDAGAGALERGVQNLMPQGLKDIIEQQGINDFNRAAREMVAGDAAYMNARQIQNLPEPIQEVLKTVQPAATSKAQAEEKKPQTFRERLGAAFQDPIFQMGMNLMANQNPNFFHALGEAGIATGKQQAAQAAAAQDAALKREKANIERIGKEAYAKQVEAQAANMLSDRRLVTEMMKKREDARKAAYNSALASGYTDAQAREMADRAAASVPIPGQRLRFDLSDL